MKIPIDNKTRDRILSLHRKDKNWRHYSSVTHWVKENFNVVFNGGITEPYYIEGLEEKLTWFLLKL
jgi:hypothetical protein